MCFSVNLKQTKFDKRCLNSLCFSITCSITSKDHWECFRSSHVSAATTWCYHHCASPMSLYVLVQEQILSFFTLWPFHCLGSSGFLLSQDITHDCTAVTLMDLPSFLFSYRWTFFPLINSCQVLMLVYPCIKKCNLHRWNLNLRLWGDMNCLNDSSKKAYLGNKETPVCHMCQYY